MWLSNERKPKRHDVSDHELIQQAQAGDMRAFEELVKKYEAQVAATVIGMLGNVAEAEDVGQEVFVRFHQALPQFRGEAALGTYLTRIAINLSLNALKRRRRRRLFFVQPKEEPELAVAPEDMAATQENRELIQRALEKLKPEFRSVVVLRLIEDYSVEETAGILQVPPGTVFSRLARAQKKLRKILTPILKENA